MDEYWRWKIIISDFFFLIKFKYNLLLDLIYISCMSKVASNFIFLIVLCQDFHSAIRIRVNLFCVQRFAFYMSSDFLV